MPSLRKRVSSYLRQLSFHNEPNRDKRNSINENAFVTKYLQGIITLSDIPPTIYGKNPTDLPNYELGKYECGSNTITGSYTGPNGGLTTVKRIEKHLSLLHEDIDFIDNPVPEEPIASPVSSKKSPIKREMGHHPIDNTTMMIKVAGNEYCVTNKPKRHSKSLSLGSISKFSQIIEVEKTKIDKEFYNCDNNTTKQHETSSNNNSEPIQGKKNVVVDCDNLKTAIVKSNEEINNKKSSSLRNTNNKKTFNSRIEQTKINNNKSQIILESHNKNNYALSKSKSDGNPFNRKKRGKIIQVQRQQTYRDTSTLDLIEAIPLQNDLVLPKEWNKKADFCYGLSDSLYDRNQVTKTNNGDPIADCFGIITRNDSAILAVADGVNWGEKACIAAKSAVHASLHYLNKTIFNDTKLFENLTTKTDNDVALTGDSLNSSGEYNIIGNTKDVFVCLLRAFNCAHDLILENKGMLTTLTVAVVLPLRANIQDSNKYVCCVCNVGDTLAYIYSQKNGIRELTKGSHDINSNRDMRDALGALGPVDGINPELSNLTLSITTLNKGDIVMVASDGLTDNFDPNVCRFTVNSRVVDSNNKNSIRKSAAGRIAATTAAKTDQKFQSEPQQRPPIKPPRRSKNRASISSGGSQSERSNSSVEKELLKSSSINQTPTTTAKQEIFELTNNDPLKAHFLRENSLEETKNKVEIKKPPPPSVIENKASSLRKLASMQNKTFDSNNVATHSSYKFLKSKTSLDLRSNHHHHQHHSNKLTIQRNEDGIPFVTPIQRYELQLLLMQDILKNGISGRDAPITTAKKLCENLLSFTQSITAAKRRTLEDPDLYFDSNRNGILVEVSNQEKKMRRKRGLEKVQMLPGKLDHVTIVAYNVGNVVM